MSSYMRAKKVHKTKKYVSVLLPDMSYGFRMGTVCKVENKTYAYKKSQAWARVNCEQCLRKRATV